MRQVTPKTKIRDRIYCFTGRQKKKKKKKKKKKHEQKENNKEASYTNLTPTISFPKTRE